MNVREKYFATRYEIQNNGLNFLNMNLKIDCRNIVEKKYLILCLIILNTYYLIYTLYMYKTLIQKM